MDVLAIEVVAKIIKVCFVTDVSDFLKLLEYLDFLWAYFWNQRAVELN